MLLFVRKARGRHATAHFTRMAPQNRGVMDGPPIRHQNPGAAEIFPPTEMDPKRYCPPF